MSTNRPPKSYPNEVREKAVRLVIEGGYPLKQVANKFGCSPETVRRWKEAQKASLAPDGAPKMTLDENENKRLQKEVVRLQMALDILKKATAYFAREML
jgi:transposase